MGGYSWPRRTFSTEAFAEQGEEPAPHETAVVSSWSSFAEALEASRPHEKQSALSDNKRLVGALDSACNRTVCGRGWLEGYLEALSSSPLARPWPPWSRPSRSARTLSSETMA